MFSRLYLQFAAKELVFNPHTQLKAQISAASKSITDHFHDIDSAIDDGVPVSQAVKGKRIRAVMRRVISSARTSGFLTASKHSKKKMPALYGRTVDADAKKRARRVGKWMRGTTKRTLKNSPESDFTLSEARALRAAKFEASKAYFQGVADGFKGSGYQKQWITSSDEPCPDCQDNEDQGPIGVDEEFQSGDAYPLAHLSCGCVVGLVK